MRRAACAALAGALFLTSTGCASAEYAAQSQADRIHIGMTADEVERELGRPALREVREDSGAGEVWTYMYSSGADPRPHVFFVKALVVVLLLVIVAAASSSRGISGWGGLGFHDEHAQVVITFDPDTGRVRGVTLRR